MQEVLANVLLAGEGHQLAIWHRFFPDEFVKISKIRKLEISDPLSMVIYTCCDGNPRRLVELCGDQGVFIVATIVRTALTDGFGEDWLKLLLSRICVEEHFPSLFSKLSPNAASRSLEEVTKFGEYRFASEQAFLLSIVSEILNERIRERIIFDNFALTPSMF